MAVFDGVTPAIVGAAGAGGAAGYEIERSLRFNSADSAYLSRTPSTASNRKTFTFSCWVKLSKLGTGQTIFAGYDGSANNQFEIRLETNDTFFLNTGGNAGNRTVASTTAVYRDPSAWYHLVCAVDTTQASASDHFKFYINGNLQTLSVSESGPQNLDTQVNGTFLHHIGVARLLARYFNGYLADVHFIDGQALAATDFGEYDDNNVWQPKEFTGSYGAVAVSEATGALPIFNTTDTYGAVKGTGTRTDSNSSTIALALGLDGANGGTTWSDQSATIKGSGSAKTITPNNNVQTSTTQSFFYGSSTYFDGSGDRLVLSNASDLTFSGDFTMETWLYINDPNSVVYPNGDRQIAGVWSGVNNDWQFNYSAGGSHNLFQFLIFTGGTVVVVNSGVNMSAYVGKWVHLAVVRNSGSIQCYVDGVAKGSAVSNSSTFGQTSNVAVGGRVGVDARTVAGYLSDFRIYKSAKYTSNFTVVKDNNGNSFHLPFSDNSSAAALGYDAVGSNDWTVNNLSVAPGAGNDSLVDSPTNGTQTDTGVGGEVVGNYATLNPLRNGGLTLSNGNLQANRATTSWQSTFGTIGITSGKYFWEAQIVTSASINYIDLGIANATVSPSGTYRSTSGYSYNGNDELYANGSYVSTYGGTYTAGDIIGVAFDADAGTLVYYKNGTSLGTAFSSIPSGTWFPAVALYGTREVAFNFGQRAFAYTAPSGYKALCTTNLPDPTIADGSTAMDVLTWTGDGNYPRTISGLSMQSAPDLIWIKCRGIGAYHVLQDSVRGFGSGKNLTPALTFAEGSDNDGFITGSSTTGITLGATNNVQGSGVNRSGYGGYVGWTWDAGTSTVTNTDGSITSSVRASASSGFSIVTFNMGSNGAKTVGHGLNAEPHLIITKCRTDAFAWRTYHKSATTINQFLELDSNGGISTSTGHWGSAAPTSSVFGITSGQAQPANEDCVAYCFAPVDGYSNGFSYTGNGSTDGSFVYLGFRPRLILLKCSSTTGNWTLLDTAREGYNVDNDPLYPNLSNAEGTTDLLDITSNGFKLRTTDASVNSSGATYVGYAWAETPFAYSRAR